MVSDTDYDRAVWILFLFSYLFCTLFFTCRYMTSSLNLQSYGHCKLFHFRNIMVVVVVDRVLFMLIISQLFSFKGSFNVSLNRKPQAKLWSQSTVNLFYLPLVERLHVNFETTTCVNLTPNCNLKSFCEIYSTL